MADERVRDVQNWLNDTYGDVPGFGYVEPDGYTGNEVVNGLIRALQHELGISPFVNNFGPSTESEYTAQLGTIKKQDVGSDPQNINYILQGAFYAKGYNPGGFTGNFLDGTESKVKDFQSDIGITQTGEVSAKVMKALLNTDGYMLSDPSDGQIGQPYIRWIQQALNKDYAYNSEYDKWLFDYIPTNGTYDRHTNKALIYALQVEEGIADIANGHFGPSTIREYPTLSVGNTGNFVKILQWALGCNGVDFYVGSFDGIFGQATRDAVVSFQEFMALNVTGIADMETINQLLTSNGYEYRSADACDASTIVDDAKAQTLVQNGYEVIGRYLTGTVGGTRSKAMTADELQILENHGIRVFPIYQNGGWYTDYFADGQGTSDALRAIHAATKLGFPNGATIYFAVDFDAYDFQVRNLIIPYFREINDVFAEVNNNDNFSYLNNYQVGVYGSRNMCSKLHILDLASYSFVSNMSTGYSGNLGYPMPENWSFDQFYEIPIGSGTGNIRIDKCGYSGKDTGVSAVNPDPSGLDPNYLALLDKWQSTGGKIPILAQYYPELFSTDFSFNQPVLKIGHASGIKVEVNAKTTINTIPSDFTIFEVENGSVLNLNTSDALGDDFKAQVGVDAFERSENLLKSASFGISLGKIAIKVSPGSRTIEMKIIEESIYVEETNTNLKLQVDISIIVDEPTSGTNYPNLTPVFVAENVSEPLAYLTGISLIVIVALTVADLIGPI